jgi:hypothetical protein
MEHVMITLEKNGNTTIVTDTDRRIAYRVTWYEDAKSAAETRRRNDALKRGFEASGLIGLFDVTGGRADIQMHPTLREKAPVARKAG